MIMDSRATDASHASELSEATNAASWLEDTIEDDALSGVIKEEESTSTRISQVEATFD